MSGSFCSECVAEFAGLTGQPCVAIHLDGFYGALPFFEGPDVFHEVRVIFLIELVEGDCDGWCQ